MENHYLLSPGQVVEVEGPMLLIAPGRARPQENPLEIDGQDVVHERPRLRIRPIDTQRAHSSTE